MKRHIGMPNGGRKMSSKKARRKREYLERERKRKARKVFDVKYPNTWEDASIEEKVIALGIKLK